MSAPALASPPAERPPAKCPPPPHAAPRAEPTAWEVVRRFFGDEERASRWFHAPHRVLGGKTPAEAAETAEGTWEVRAIIGRVEHGVFG